MLVMLALLVAPAGMLGSHAAMAMPHQAAATGVDHCEKKQNVPAEDQRRSMIDCAIACSAMPSAAPFQAPSSLFAAPEYRRATLLDIEGTRPEAATPPPRLS